MDTFYGKPRVSWLIQTIITKCVHVCIHKHRHTHMNEFLGLVFWREGSTARPGIDSLQKSVLPSLHSAWSTVGLTTSPLREKNTKQRHLPWSPPLTDLQTPIPLTNSLLHPMERFWTWKPGLQVDSFLLSHHIPGCQSMRCQSYLSKSEAHHES